MPVKKVKSLAPSAPSTQQGDLFGQPAARTEPTPTPASEVSVRPAPATQPVARAPAPVQPEALDAGAPTELAVSRETVRVDLAPSRPRE
ncbi:MAG: hypothetical protein ACXWLG_14995, partial [Myxococcaceae bacterium]